MSIELVAAVIAGYFSLVFLIAYLTAKGATSDTFFNAQRQSPWYVVAFGMIGASMSGVTFISVTGMVGNQGFAYLQMVLGYLLGYSFIARVLMPLYYRMNLVSIYQYLETRLGFWSYKTGAFFFLLSRTIGAAFRLFVVALVLQQFLFGPLGINFYVTVFFSLALIWLYTFRGGIKTVVWTDTLQTAFMLLSVVVTIGIIADRLSWGFGDMVAAIRESPMSDTFIWDNSPQNFFKQFLSGAFIAIVMTGLDQDMMQKNLTCRNIGDAQKNMYWFSIALVFVNVMFLSLGALLYLYAGQQGIELPLKESGAFDGDRVYPMIAYEHLGVGAGVVFLLGVVAAAYSSADSALTALTTSFCIDFLDFAKTGTGEAKKRMRRIQVHLMFSVLLFVVIALFHAINNRSVIDAVFTAAGYTYGPLLGLYAFGLFTKLAVHDRLVPLVCGLSPLACFVLNRYSAELLWGYSFGFELLIVNGLLTFLGLVAVSKRA
jgi:Na+/proline symporter